MTKMSADSCTRTTRICAAGRKPESKVWSYFKVDQVNKKCECQVLDHSGQVCGRVIVGRNTTNAKVHLKAFHKQKFIALEQEEKEMKKKKVTVSSKAANQGSNSNLTTGTGSKTIISMLKEPRKWLPESFEKQKGDSALVNMIVGCGLPMMTVGKPSFKQFCDALDPRYSVPSVGKLGQLFNEKYRACKERLLESLKSAR